MNTSLVTFPAPLLRLILCGGKGLAPAWGPLKHTDEDCETPWYPTFGAAIVSSDEGRGYLHTNPINEPDGWSIPLDDASPWPARLAMVTAWMVRHQQGVSMLIDGGVNLSLTTITERGGVASSIWSRPVGLCLNGQVPWPHLPTLTDHLTTHPPAVALLLALYDVPEIRSRVESA